MLDELVGDAHAVHVGFVAIVGHKFEYCAAETALDGAVLESYDALMLASHLVEDILVDGFEESHIVVCHADTLACHALNGFGCKVTH